MTKTLSDHTTLTFDCYGTLIDWETGIARALDPWLSRNGLTLGPEEILAAFGAAESSQQRRTPGALYPDILRGAVGDMAARWQAPLGPEEGDAFAASVRDWPPFPDSAEALAYLKGHYKLVIISNIDRESFRHSNDKLGVAFDLIVTAQDVGSYKPDLRNFHYTIEKLGEIGVARDEILHCAQSLFHDHVPAKELGLTSVWINRRAGRKGWGATSAPPREVSPDFEFPSMAAFADAHRALIGGG